MVWRSGPHVNERGMRHFVAPLRGGGDARPTDGTQAPFMIATSGAGAFTGQSPPRRGELGLSLIVAYKLGKSALQLVAALALELALITGAAVRLHDLAAVATEHGTSRLSTLVAHALGQLTTTRHLHLVVFALALDAVASAVEGWALHRRYRWAPWLIVVATFVAVPFEVASLVHALRPIRLALLLINLALVAYLARRALRERRAPILS
jgi:uncharacterized membrane protein (DUF2068 family)